MTTTKIVSFDPQWERTRAILSYLSEDADHSNTPSTYQPGDISVCAGSVGFAFYQTVRNLGISLTREEKLLYQNFTKPPIRYCVINRHIHDQIYEVFLLTTYGGATSFRALDGAARRFSMPMGLTKWPERTPGVTTVPNIFGQETSSFLFAMSTLQQVPPTKVNARVPMYELERIRKFAQAQKEVLLNDDWVIRKSVYERHQGRVWFGDEGFSLMPEKDPKTALQDDDVVNDGPFVKAYTSRLHPVRAMTGIHLHRRHESNIRWILRHSKNDVIHSSKYLSNKHITQPQRFTLPLPYFAKSLRLSSTKLMRLIR
ncbi:hypothetical protein BJ912DRAFT_946393 [Pholiota molesta]|nr:hypothetical protein BJ912DRAFT_946393 [Pholiota molesta]